MQFIDSQDTEKCSAGIIPAVLISQYPQHGITVWSLLICK